MVVPGDSGGLFWKNTNSMSWELAGIHMDYVGDPYQPEFSTLPASVFGAISYSADLAFYRNEIYSSIPEPKEYALVFGLFALAFVFFHRQMQKKRRQQQSTTAIHS